MMLNTIEKPCKKPIMLFTSGAVEQNRERLTRFGQVKQIKRKSLLLRKVIIFKLDCDGIFVL